MDVGLISRVGLQLLLEPHSTAFIARGACVAVGALYPAYATYKTVVVPKRGGPTATNTTSASPQSRGSVHSVQGERWLKYWALFGLTVVAERLLDGHLDRVPFYPHAKLIFLLWLQASQGHGASLLFDGHLAPWLCRYERKLDTLLEVGAQALAALHTTYAAPLSYLQHTLTLGLAQLGAFLRWISTPDDKPPSVGGGGGGGGSSGSGSSVGRGGVSSSAAHNLIR